MSLKFNIQYRQMLACKPNTVPITARPTAERSNDLPVPKTAREGSNTVKRDLLASIKNSSLVTDDFTKRNTPKVGSNKIRKSQQRPQTISLLDHLEATSHQNQCRTSLNFSDAETQVNPNNTIALSFFKRGDLLPSSLNQENQIAPSVLPIYRQTKQQFASRICQNLLGSFPDFQKTHRPQTYSSESERTKVLCRKNIQRTSNLFSRNTDHRLKELITSVQISKQSRTIDIQSAGLHEPTFADQFSHKAELVIIDQDDHETKAISNKLDVVPISPGRRTQRTHTSNQMMAMRRKMRNQVAQSFQDKNSRLKDFDWKNASAFQKSLEQASHPIAKFSRIDVISQMTSRKSNIITAMEQNNYHVAKQKDPVSYDTRDNKRMIDSPVKFQVELLEKRAMLDDMHQLRVHLSKKKPYRADKSVTRYLFTSSNYQTQLRKQQEDELTRKSQMKENLNSSPKRKANKLRVENVEKVDQAMNQIKSIKITDDQVADAIAGGPSQKIEIMMKRSKYENDEEFKEQEEIRKKINTHVERVFNDPQYMNELNSPKRLGIQGGINSRSPNRKLKRSSTFELRKLEVISNSELSPKKRAELFRMKNLEKNQCSGLNKSLVGFNIKLNSDIFSNFIHRRDQTASVAQEQNKLLEKLYFNQMTKQINLRPATQAETFNYDPRLQFMMPGELVIDLTSKIYQKCLTLVDFPLSFGQCKGFFNCCSVDDDLITHVVIDNCSLNDQMLSIVLDGLMIQRRIVLLHLRRTEIGQQSANRLCQMLQRIIPQHLDDFKLEKCQISKHATTTILNTLAVDSNLQKLYLLGLSIDESQLQLIRSFISKAKYLTSIDLSWNRFSVMSGFITVFQEICANRRLSNISLAWNSLVENNNLGNVGSFNLNEQELNSRKTFRKRKVPASKQLTPSERKIAKQLGWTAEVERKVLNSQEQLVVKCLKSLITENSRLMHLDLSNTGLTQDMLLEIAIAIPYSKSLIGIHLSGNPGLNEYTKHKVYSKLGATFEKPHKLNSYFSLLNRTSSPELNKYPEKQLLEGIQIKHIKAQKQALFPTPVGNIDDQQNRHFILTRKLGHYYDIPAGSEWQAFTHAFDECFYCDRKIYTLFIWSREVGIISDDELGFSDEQKRQVANFIYLKRDRNILRAEKTQIPEGITRSKIEEPTFKQTNLEYVTSESVLLSSDTETDIIAYDQKNSTEAEVQTPDIQIKSEGQLKQVPDSQTFSSVTNEENGTRLGKSVKINGQEVPQLFGSFNNWQSQPMIQVNLLAEHVLDEDKPDFLDQLIEENQCRQSVTDLSQLNKKERELYKQAVNEFKDSFKTFSVWQRAVKKMIAYKHPHICGIEQMQLVDPKEIFVTANYVGCGKQNYAVQYENKLYLHKTIADFRREDIVHVSTTAKELGKKEHNPNVFKTFQCDNQQILNSCFNCDVEGLKISKFIKSSQEVNDLMRVVKKEYVYLKDLFQELASRSNYPGIFMPDFENFVLKAGVLEDVRGVGLIEIQFIAARTDAEDRNFKVFGQQSLDINRFEFIEALIRVANQKFISQGQAQSASEAFQMLIDLIKENFKFSTQQEFRNQLLYTREVNLTLDANKKGLFDLYELNLNKKTQRLSMIKAIELLTENQSKLRLTVQNARHCFGLCQQTCADLVKNSYLSVGHIVFVEFLELIARVADIYFEEIDLPLHEKINLLLDNWLPLVGHERQEAQYYEEDQLLTQSDEQNQNILPQPKLLKIELRNLASVMIDD